MTTILETAARANADRAHQAALADFIKLARLTARGISYLEAKQDPNASKRVLELLSKTVVGAGSLTDWSAIAEYRTASNAFSESLRTASIYDAALPFFAPAPLRSRGITVTTGISGAVVGENQNKIVSKILLGSALVEPRKSVGFVVASDEVFKRQDETTTRLFESELRKAVAAATDAVFLAELIAATTPTASAGSTLANVTTDIAVLLAAVTTHANSVLFFICSPANMKKLATKANSLGAPAFPNIGPNGGTFMPGVTAIASDQISSGAALLVDATQIAGSADIIALARSNNPTLQMVDSAPDSPETASTVVLSLWQHGLQALVAERFFGFTLLRATAVASLSGVSY
jgi:hypothetical protein